MCGDFQVGKTSIKRNLIGETFKTDHLPTLGVDIVVKSIPITETVDLDLQIWDFGGQPAFAELRQRYFHGVAAAVLVFDITREESFFNLNRWIEEIWQNPENRKSLIMILANKADLVNFKFKTQQIVKFLDYLQEQSEFDIVLSYRIVSAKTGLNVEDSFINLSKSIYKNTIEVESSNK